MPPPSMDSNLAAAERGVRGHPLRSPGELGEAWHQPTVQLSEAGERLRGLVGCFGRS